LYASVELIVCFDVCLITIEQFQDISIKLWSTAKIGRQTAALQHLMSLMIKLPYIHVHTMTAACWRLPEWMLKWLKHHTLDSSGSEGYQDRYYRLHRLQQQQ